MFTPAALSIVFLISQAAVPNQTSMCNAAKDVLVVPGVCAETDTGAVVSQSQEGVEELMRYAHQGEERFRKYFGRTVPRYFIVQAAVNEEQRVKLRAAGFAVVLQWFTPEQYQSGIEASVHKQIEAQAAAHAWTPEQAKAAEEKATNQIRQLTPGGRTALHRDPTAVPHELGHGWYVQSFWPGFVTDGSQHYGGPGPDWLDEASAILMEDDESSDDRREQFRQARKRGDEIDDPATFLHRDHPMKTNATRLKAAESRGPVISVVTGDASNPEFRKMMQAGLFYSQCRVFADFLLETSHDDQVLASVALAFAKGETIETWLKSSGAKEHLPGNLPDLSRAWTLWLNGRYPVGK